MEGWIEEYKQWTICWDTIGKLNAIADQVRLQAVHSDDYWQKQDLIFQVRSYSCEFIIIEQ